MQLVCTDGVTRVRAKSVNCGFFLNSCQTGDFEFVHSLGDSGGNYHKHSLYPGMLCIIATDLSCITMIQKILIACLNQFKVCDMYWHITVYTELETPSLQQVHCSF